MEDKVTELKAKEEYEEGVKAKHAAELEVAKEERKQ